MKKKKLGLLSGMAAVIAGAALLVPVTAAQAAGSFNVAYAPPSCSETTFSGGSGLTSNGGRAWSSNVNTMWCGAGFPNLTARVTLNGITASQSSVNTWTQQFVQSTLSGARNGVQGRHTLAGYVRLT